MRRVGKRILKRAVKIGREEIVFISFVVVFSIVSFSSGEALDFFRADVTTSIDEEPVVEAFGVLGVRAGQELEEVVWLEVVAADSTLSADDGVGPFGENVRESIGG